MHAFQLRRRRKHRKPIDADEWNARHKLGTAVTVALDDGTHLQTTTRSAAWDLDSGRTLVLVEGKTGGYDLSRVTPR